jgi:preprotein translocase subunit SecF
MGGTVDDEGDVMRRVLAVVLIATLTTMMIGIDTTSWAAQDRDQEKRQKQQAAVTKALGEMAPGSTAAIERQDGQKMDVVIQEITPDAVTVMRQQQDQIVTETIPIADIAKIKKISAKKMSKTSKVLIGTAVALGVLVTVALATCAVSYSERSRTSEATH